MGTISKNFSYREFEKSLTADRLGICNVIITVRVRDAVRALTLNILQPLRDAVKRAVVISSGYRCAELNKHVPGSSATSQHPKGEAADIYVLLEDGSRMPSVELARIIIQLGLPFDQLIIYPTFVHVSHKLEGAQRGNVLYNKSYNGPRV
jgi:hypothetical protein